MNWIPWFKWLGGYLLIFVAVFVVAFTVAMSTGDYDVAQSTSGRTIVLLAALVILAWSVWGLHLISDGEQQRWIKYIQGFVVSITLAQGFGGIAQVMWPMYLDNIFRIGGVFLLSIWAFILLLEVARLALSPSWQPLAVAREVLDEAVAMKVVVALVVIALIALAALPFLLNPDEPLRYQVQTFLSWSMAISTVLLSIMTILLACWTLSNEITDKQIHMVAVKPVSRGTYLLGKWIGVVTLNGVLLAVVGVAIYAFVTLYLTSDSAMRDRAMDDEDRIAVMNEVMIARISSRPEPPRPLADEVADTLKKMMQERPQDVMAMGKDEASDQGITFAGDAKLMQLGQERALRLLSNDAWDEWLTLGPNEFETYVFKGLKPALKTWLKRYNAWYPRAEKKIKELTGEQVDLSNHLKADGVLRELYGKHPDAYAQVPPRPLDWMVLRYKIRAPGSENIMMRMRVNGRPAEEKMLVGEVQVMKIPVNFIDDNGELTIQMAVAFDQYPRDKAPTASFTTKEGLSILFPVDRFTPNFIRAFLALWVKLAFLAMVGLFAATFVSFPVASMLAFTVYGAAVLSTYMLESLRAFGLGDTWIGHALAWLITTIATVVSTLISKFGEFTPREQVVEGLLFSWSDLAQCFLWNGLIQTGLLALLAWWIYSKKELARVQV
ncbi:MAG: hypothetical protein GC159_14735 [Phycisphaera sp.]|nr:hypothetical protein [Phycisphaera sp.]